VATTALVACGDGSEPATPTTSPPQALSAGALIPDLTQLGYTKTGDERDPAAQAGQDARRALYEKAAAPKSSVRVDVVVLTDEAAAIKQFAAVSEALKNPPADIFEGKSVPKDSTPIAGLGAQSRSFVTAQPDKDSNLVWTDAYRSGRVVIIIQVLLKTSELAPPLRTSIAQAVLAKIG
jgi:hypothetical protein